MRTAPRRPNYQHQVQKIIYVITAPSVSYKIIKLLFSRLAQCFITSDKIHVNQNLQLLICWFGILSCAIEMFKISQYVYMLLNYSPFIINGSQI